MTVFRNLISSLQKWAVGLLLLLWLPSTSHCLLEHAQFWTGESCCEKRHDTASVPFQEDCTTCTTLGEGRYVKPPADHPVGALFALPEDAPKPADIFADARRRTPRVSALLQQLLDLASNPRVDNRAPLLVASRIHPIRGPNLFEA